MKSFAFQSLPVDQLMLVWATYYVAVRVSEYIHPVVDNSQQQQQGQGQQGATTAIPVPDPQLAAAALGMNGATM